MIVALLGCSKNKRKDICKAQDMYLPSVLFRKASTYIKQQNYDDWFILSAKYGLLEKDMSIAPYEVCLTDMPKGTKTEWSKIVFDQLVKYNIKSIDFYCGVLYRQYLIPMLTNHNIICNVPLRRMGIGKQLQFYTDNIK
jgi:hypothetical protein